MNVQENEGNKRRMCRTTIEKWKEQLPSFGFRAIVVTTNQKLTLSFRLKSLKLAKEIPFLVRK